ncbi:MAG: hypothetical protein QM805_26325 [Pseudomonas sp.]
MCLGEAFLVAQDLAGQQIQQLTLVAQRAGGGIEGKQGGQGEGAGTVDAELAEQLAAHVDEQDGAIATRVAGETQQAVVSPVLLYPRITGSSHPIAASSTEDGRRSGLRSEPVMRQTDAGGFMKSRSGERPQSLPATWATSVLPPPNTRREREGQLISWSISTALV